MTEETRHNAQTTTRPVSDSRTAQVAMPEIGDGSGVGRGQQTVRVTTVPHVATSCRATVPTAPQVPTAVGQGPQGAAIRWVDDLDELDFDAVEEATDPDVSPPLFAEMMHAQRDADGMPPLPSEPAAVRTQVAEVAPPLPPSEVAPPLPTATAAPVREPARRHKKVDRKAKKQNRAAQKARARATSRAAGSGPIAEELPADAIEEAPFFTSPPALPDMGTFELQMPTKRRHSRQDMQEMLQEFSVMFRMDTKVRKRRAGWFLGAGLVAVAAATAFLLTRTAPVDTAADEAMRVALAHAEISHALATVYVLTSDARVQLPSGATSTAKRPVAQRKQVSLLALKLGQLVHLRALKRATPRRP